MAGGMTTILAAISRISRRYSLKLSPYKISLILGFCALLLLQLFYFGYGLSFTTFSYANLRVTPLPLSPAGGSSSGSNANLVEMRGADNTAVWNVSVEVKNEGKMAGTEVVQVYVQDPAGLPFVPFWKRLLGFGRITLEAGATSVCIIQVEWQGNSILAIARRLAEFTNKFGILL